MGAQARLQVEKRLIEGDSGSGQSSVSNPPAHPTPAPLTSSVDERSLPGCMVLVPNFRRVSLQPPPQLPYLFLMVPCLCFPLFLSLSLLFKKKKIYLAAPDLCCNTKDL